MKLRANTWLGHQQFAHPRPISITWNDHSGKSFEDFVFRFKGHVNQQPNMGYIILDTIGFLWAHHGDPHHFLSLGIHNQVHPSLHHISTIQFQNDIVWLFGALQQALVDRGKEIVMSYEHTQDGLCVWKKLISTYRYGGNVEVYLAKQMEIVSQKYHPNTHMG